MMNIDKCMEDIRTLMPLGKSLQYIADLHGVTRQRIHQVLKKMYIEPGVLIGQKAKMAKLREKAIAKEVDRFGMTKIERSIVIDMCAKNGWANPVQAYKVQRSNAQGRRISWEFTFGSWWRVWEPHYSKRGRGMGKVEMCRKGDVGPYSESNVYIASHTKNIRDYWEKKMVDL